MTYQIVTLKSIKNDPAVGDRVARIIAKKGVIGTRTIESQGVVLPQVSLAVLNAILSDEVGKEWIRSRVQDAQDTIIRKHVENGKAALFDDMIGLGALLASMAAIEAATRFSKESIGAWFDDDLADLLDVAIRSKVNGISQDKLDSLLSGYKADFQTLAAREVFMAPEMKAKLQKALNLLPDDYESSHAATAEKLFEKFANAGTKAKVEDVL